MHPRVGPLVRRANDRVVDALEVRCVLELDVPAGPQRLECRQEDVEVRSKAGGEHAAVDEVERLFVQPRVFGVVNFKVAIRENAGRGVSDPWLCCMY
jgi:hypothetical protein